MKEKHFSFLGNLKPDTCTIKIDENFSRYPLSKMIHLRRYVLMYHIGADLETYSFTSLLQLFSIQFIK